MNTHEYHLFGRWNENCRQEISDLFLISQILSVDTDFSMTAIKNALSRLENLASEGSSIRRVEKRILVPLRTSCQCYNIESCDCNNSLESKAFDS